MCQKVNVHMTSTFQNKIDLSLTPTVMFGTTIFHHSTFWKSMLRKLVLWRSTIQNSRPCIKVDLLGVDLPCVDVTAGSLTLHMPRLGHYRELNEATRKYWWHVPIVSLLLCILVCWSFYFGCALLGQKKKMYTAWPFQCHKKMPGSLCQDSWSAHCRGAKCNRCNYFIFCPYRFTFLYLVDIWYF